MEGDRQRLIGRVSTARCCLRRTQRAIRDLTRREPAALNSPTRRSCKAERPRGQSHQDRSGWSSRHAPTSVFRKPETDAGAERLSGAMFAGFAARTSNAHWLVNRLAKDLSPLGVVGNHPNIDLHGPIGTDEGSCSCAWMAVLNTHPITPEDLTRQLGSPAWFVPSSCRTLHDRRRRRRSCSRSRQLRQHVAAFRLGPALPDPP